MNITIVSGSHRKTSMSRKVSDWIADRLRAEWEDDVQVIDLAHASLPMWDEEFGDDHEGWEAAFGPIRDRLKVTDALVTVTPEWSGMATPGIKNFFLLCNAELVGHKPSLLVAVSAGRGGAYPIAEMRASSYKNTRVCHIPEHLIVRGVGDVLNGPEPEGRSDSYIRERIDYALGVLRAYGEALQVVRASGAIDHARHPNGM